MTTASVIAVSGPSGSGKTTWISQLLNDSPAQAFYLCPGSSNISVDLARIGYRFPQVQVISEDQAQQTLTSLPDLAMVILELGFHLDLNSPLITSLPSHRVAVLPPNLTDSEWQDWADEIIPGNDIVVDPASKPPQLWCTSLTGQVFDPSSLDEVLIELTGGAYGNVQRVKGIFEMPDGRAFYVDFVEGLPGLEYTELNLPPWLEGRPHRFSGIEVVGQNLEQATIAQAFLDSCLSDGAIAQYQQHYQTLPQEVFTR